MKGYVPSMRELIQGGDPAATVEEFDRLAAFLAGFAETVLLETRGVPSSPVGIPGPAGSTGAQGPPGVNNGATPGEVGVSGGDTYITNVNNTDGGVTYVTAPGAPKLLRAASGTSVTTPFIIVDTVDIEELGDLDTIQIFYTLESQVTNTGSPQVYHVTDSGILVLALSTLVAGGTAQGIITLRRAQSSRNLIVGHTINGYTGGNTQTINILTTSTPWDDPWTLGLRYQSLTAGGTFCWSWTVMKISGTEEESEA